MEDRGRCPAVDSLRRGRPRAPSLHARAGPRRGDRERRAQDEVALWGPTRALQPRRGDAARGEGGAPHRDGCRSHPPPRSEPHRRLPARRRPHRPRGGAAALPRGRRERARFPRPDSISRPAGRRRGAASRPTLSRPARSLLSAEAPLARRLPPAPRRLCRVRRGGGPRRFLATGGRSRLRLLRGWLDPDLGRGLRGDAGRCSSGHSPRRWQPGRPCADCASACA